MTKNLIRAYDLSLSLICVRVKRSSRISARSEQFDMLLHLDVNTEIYPGEKFMMVLASTLNLDGTPDTGFYTPGNRKSLADKFDYFMQGKLYRISEETKEKHVKAEFGPLGRSDNNVTVIGYHVNISLVKPAFILHFAYDDCILE